MGADSVNPALQSCRRFPLAFALVAIPGAAQSNGRSSETIATRQALDSD